MRSADRRAVIRQGWTIGLATGAYGVSFGALSVASGLTVAQTQVLSLLMFTGGSQFAFAGVIGAGGLAAAPAAIATAGLLGVRNGIYALQTSRFLQVRGVRRLAAAQLTIDESTAVGIAQSDPKLQRTGFWHTGVAVFVFWNLLTLLGAVLGNAPGDDERSDCQVQQSHLPEREVTFCGGLRRDEACEPSEEGAARRRGEEVGYGGAKLAAGVIARCLELTQMLDAGRPHHPPEVLDVGYAEARRA